MHKHICAYIQNGEYVKINPILSLAEFQSLNDHFHLRTEVNKNDVFKNKLGVKFYTSKIFNSAHAVILSIVTINLDHNFHHNYFNYSVSCHLSLKTTV